MIRTPDGRQHGPQLIRGGHQYVVFDMSPATVAHLVAEGATGSIRSMIS